MKVTKNNAETAYGGDRARFLAVLARFEPRDEMASPERLRRHARPVVPGHDSEQAVRGVRERREVAVLVHELRVLQAAEQPHGERAYT